LRESSELDDREERIEAVDQATRLVDEEGEEEEDNMCVESSW
jgi:hypothetical protein